MVLFRLLCVRIEIGQLYADNSLLYNWLPNSDILLNNSQLELIYFLNKPVFA